MKLKNHIKLTLMLLCFGICLHAETRTADFNDFPNATSNPEQDQFTISAGFTFNFSHSSGHQDGGTIIVGNPTGSPFSDQLGSPAVSNGTPYLGVAALANDFVTMTLGGPTFGLTSIDFDKVLVSDAAAGAAGFPFPSATTINVVGTFAGGGTITATVNLNGSTVFQTFTFPSGWQNLVSVKFTANNNGSASFAMDNIVFTLPPCSYQLSVVSVAVNGQPIAGRLVGSGAGSQGLFRLDTGPGCPWSISAVPDWITITSPTSGSGGGYVIIVSFTANPGATRTGIITIAGVDFIVQQAGSVPVINLIGSMPHVAAQENWTTTFIAVNKGATTVTGRLNLTSDSGTGLPLYLTFPQGGPALPLFGQVLDFPLAPNAIGITSSVGPQTPPVQTGAARLASDGAVDGFAIFSFLPTKQEAVVPLETRNAASYLLPFDNTNSVVLGVALQNVTVVAVSVTVVIRDDTGAQIDSGSIPVPASGHFSFVLSDRFPSTANKRGTIQFTTPSGGRISALGVRFTPPGTLTTIPVLASTDAPGGLISHIASANGWKTTFVLVNTGTASAQAHLKFFADNGTPLSLPLTFPQPGAGSSISATTLDRTLAAGATLIVESTGADTDPLLTGSAQLTSDGKVSGLVIFRYNPKGQEAVVPLESRTAGGYLVAFDNTAGIVTGTAVSNGSGQAVDVTVVIRNDSGVQIGTRTISLPANGHTAFGLATQFQETAGIRGTLEFSAPAGVSISALGVRTPPTLTFTTLPALTK